MLFGVSKEHDVSVGVICVCQMFGQPNHCLFDEVSGVSHPFLKAGEIAPVILEFGSEFPDCQGNGAFHLADDTFGLALAEMGKTIGNFLHIV